MERKDVTMQKKLTLTIDEGVYDGLRTVVGPRRISHFVEDLVRPHVVKSDLYTAYRAMAADRVRESEALEWAEATCGDVNPKPSSGPRQRVGT
jgi:hypothetical protein